MGKMTLSDGRQQAGSPHEYGLNNVRAPYQLIYCSTATRDFSDQDLLELLKKSRRRNQVRGVSGMLLYEDRCFIQVLEGKQMFVDLIYGKIKEDPRHTDVRILARGDVLERNFGDWSMGFIRPEPGLEAPEGLNEFLTKGLGNQCFIDERVHKLLLGFRSGQWHAK